MSPTLLIEGVVLLGTGLLFVMLFRRFGLGAVLGYLIGGAMIGPHGLALVGGALPKSVLRCCCFSSALSSTPHGSGG
jgi:Kef-type K+ transport system membrane component KefB